MGELLYVTHYDSAGEALSVEITQADHTILVSTAALRDFDPRFVHHDEESLTWTFGTIHPATYVERGHQTPPFDALMPRVSDAPPLSTQCLLRHG